MIPRVKDQLEIVRMWRFDCPAPSPCQLLRVAKSEVTQLVCHSVLSGERVFNAIASILNLCLILQSAV